MGCGEWCEYGEWVNMVSSASMVGGYSEWSISGYGEWGMVSGYWSGGNMVSGPSMVSVVW